jgi:DUF917 family protein
MSTFNAAAPIQPYLLGNETRVPDDQVTAQLTVHTPQQADALTRGIVSQASFGASGAFATWPCEISALSKVAIIGSVRQAIALGQLLKNVRARQLDPIPALKSFFGARMHCLYSGKLTHIDTHTVQGFDVTRVHLTSDSLPGLTVSALNESMIAWRDDLSHPLCVGPDSLCWVTETGQPFTNATLSDYASVGAPRLHLIGLTALPNLLTPPILAAYQAALAPLGYPGPYQPLSHWKSLHHGD